MRFRATIEQACMTATGIEVPVTVVEGLGAGKRPAVRVTINGHTYRSTVDVPVDLAAALKKARATFDALS